MEAHGTFELEMQAEPPYQQAQGISLARSRFDKRFEGELTGTSVVHMLGARTPVEGSAAYVALEHIEGTLGGKKGTFAAVHLGTMDRGASHLTITIVPDSGTGDLRTIRGTMSIRIVDGQHYYDLQYELGSDT